MVLAELGKKINLALNRLNDKPVVDEKLVEEVLAEICKALLQADINVKFVAKIRENIRMQFKMHQEENANHRKLI